MPINLIQSLKQSCQVDNIYGVNKGLEVLKLGLRFKAIEWQSWNSHPVLPDSKIRTLLFPMPYSVPISVSNIHVSSWIPPPLKNKKHMILFNLSSERTTELI